MKIDDIKLAHFFLIHSFFINMVCFVLSLGMLRIIPFSASKYVHTKSGNEQ